MDLPGVLFAEVNQVVHLDVVRQPRIALNTERAWGAIRIGTQQAHEVTHGQGVNVAVCDSGFFLDHQEFSGLDTRNNISVVGESLVDNSGHGTSVLSLIGGQGPELLGTAPGATYDLIKLSEFNTTTFDAEADAILAALDFGADIISLSFGGGFSELVEEATKAYAEAGGLLIAAAGNADSADTCEMLIHPGASKYAIAVGATGQHDLWAPFSCVSPWPNSPECAAPGADLGVAVHTSAEGYGLFNGTSGATPLVAGCFALHMSHHPEFWSEDGTRRDPKYEEQLPTNTVLARKILRDTCETIQATRDQVGYGLVSASQMIQWMGESNLLVPLLFGGGIIALGTLAFVATRRR
jgi:subtilisin family serine protease